MNFVYPQFLFGLLALGIPIIIHLFNFRRARKVYFSSNQFLQNIKKATSTRLKLKHYLILISRLLFLFFLVLTFAQPYLPAEEKDIQSNQAIIYLDNSFSMSNYVEEDMTALEAAIVLIQQIIDVYPRNSQFILLTNDFAPFSNSPKSSQEIEELVTEINYSGIPRSVNEVLGRIKDYYLSNYPQDVYWLSDFQASTSGSLELLAEDSSANIFIIPLIYGSASNVYVDSLYLSNPFLIENEKNNLNVILKNDGEEFIEDLYLKLSINDIQSANGSVSINPFSTAMISFDLNMNLQKFNYGSISFEDFPVIFDNDFYFVLTLSDKIVIRELKSTDSTTVIEKVFGNPSLFDFQAYPIGNIDYNDLIQADLIVLNELNDVDPTIENMLLDFLARQGDLLLIPSPNGMNVGSLSLPVSWNNIPDSTRRNLQLEQIDIDNPFFKDIFENNDPQFDMPEARAVIQITESNQDILRFRNGQKYLSYVQSANRMYTLASPLRQAYTDFYAHAIFVPVMYRIAMLSKKEFNPMYYSIDESIIKIPADSIYGESIIRMKSTDKEIVPEVRIAGSELLLDLPRFELNPAHYDIEVEGQSIGAIAFNPERNESRLAQYDMDNLSQIAGENSYVTLFNTEGFDNFDKEIKEKYLGIPLWRITLILALIFLLIEILLIRFL